MKEEENRIKLKEEENIKNGCCEETTIETAEPAKKRMLGPLSEYIRPIFSFLLLVCGLIIKHLLQWPVFDDWVELIWYLIAYLPVAYPILIRAFQTINKGALFTEYFLMSLATVCAFFIGEYPEGVAVMLFYTVGELFQEKAVRRAQLNIKTLLDVRPKSATVIRQGQTIETDPNDISIGETVLVRVGEKIPLDGILLSDDATLNTAALTGESLPRSIEKGEDLLAGMVNLSSVLEMQVAKAYHDSSIARMIDLVQNASSRKAKTELLIRRLAKVYTPIVVYLAIAICFIPYFLIADYEFSTWLYRALIFLVISCPCALVVSIPLSYFGGLGAASKEGLLFKGASYMDRLVDLSILAFDKTGTMTTGELSVVKIHTSPLIEKREMMDLLLSLEQQSTHPMALAIRNAYKPNNEWRATQVQEVAGKGISGHVNDHFVVAGNADIMKKHSIKLPSENERPGESALHVAIDGKYVGTVWVSDKLKEDAPALIHKLRTLGVKQFYMLSGDAQSVTQHVAKKLDIDHAKGGLLPHEKLASVEDLKSRKQGVVGFMGDGINDAAVLAASDVGIAMGALGSDLAIETADVVIQSDNPSKLATGIRIAKATKSIIWQNITLALGVKVVVLLLGAWGLATMWAAVFADVGVALLAILNAVRLQWKSWGND